MARIRRWVHDRGVHWFCRVRVVRREEIDHYDYSREYVQTREGDLIDVTSLAGRAVYRVEHRIEHA